MISETRKLQQMSALYRVPLHSHRISFFWPKDEKIISENDHIIICKKIMMFIYNGRFTMHRVINCSLVIISILGTVWEVNKNFCDQAMQYPHILLSIFGTGNMNSNLWLYMITSVRPKRKAAEDFTFFFFQMAIDGDVLY